MKLPRRNRSRAGSSPLVAPTLIAVFLLLILGGWYYMKRNGPGPTPPGQEPHSTRNLVLRIHGSNTIGSQLGPALVTAYLKTQGATNIKSRVTKPDESEIEATLPGESSPAIIEIQAHGSKTAFEDLCAKSADIGMASRKIESGEIQSARGAGLGDLTSLVSENVIGLDGVAVIVNRANPIQGLTVNQLAQIYSGAVTDWAQLKGAPGPIKVYARDEKSGTWETFKGKVLKSAPLVSTAQRIEDSKELSDKVSNDPFAIGFIGLPYVLNCKALAISETQADGATTDPRFPTVFTVETEEYPISRRLYFYTANNPSAWAQKLVSFAQSKAGQEVVADNGFVSQNPGVDPKQRQTTNVPELYRTLTQGRDRLSLNFYFRSGETSLDNKAIIDVGRVVDLLRDLKYSGDSVVLIGFADSVGSPDLNRRLSVERAKAVAGQFVMRGIHPASTEGLGIDMPIASNDDPAGREKNRRVEIWVTKR